MPNLKQEEIIRGLMGDIQKKIPEVELIDVTSSPDTPGGLWINVTAPEDEDREIELTDFTADKTIEILLDYGYHMLVMPETNGAQQSMELSHAS